jgi:hypothetical protein
MKIETKFDPTNTVWVIFNGKATQFNINSIKTDSSLNTTQVQYFLNVGTKEDYKCKIFDEKECFATREDLINSL